MKYLLLLIYAIWPGILWGSYAALSSFGHEGLVMDILYIVAIVVSVIAAAVAAFAAALMGKAQF